MAAVVQIENVLEAQDRGHLEMLLLVAQDVLGDRAPAMFLVVGGADEVARVALLHELGAEAAGEIGHIIHMGMHSDKDLAPVRLTGLILLNNDFGVGGNHKGTTWSSTYFRMLSR